MSNGVDVELIDEYELKELEPQARTFEKAIFSKNTGFIDSKSVLHNVYSKIQENQGEVLLSFDVQDINWSEKVVRDQKGQKLGFGKLINCAGMWADRWAHSAGLGLKYRILPFRGSYRKWLSPPTVKRSIYPVPDPELPFLGVHVTPTLGGEVLLGPNAFPAWERGGGVELRTAWSSVASLAEMFLKNKSGLRHHVYNEVQRWGKSSIFEDLQRMAPAIEKEKISGYQKSGLRAQLVNTEKMQFEMDFVIEKNKDSVHVLNAVSPGFTSSFAFAEEVVDELGEL